MRKWIVFGILLFIAFPVLGAVMAQEATKPELPAVEEVKPMLDLSGVMYFQFQQSFTEGEHSKNAYDLTRAYLTWGKKIDDSWSTRVTLDAGRNETAKDTSDPTKTEAETNYEAFIKFAYFEHKADLGAVEFRSQFGMIGTPLVGLVDRISDYRWITNNYVDKAKDLLGFSIDYSADLGACVDMKIMKVVSITGEMTNGEGFKNTQDADHGKAYYGMLTVNPVKEAFVYGIYRTNYDSNPAADEDTVYYGAGAAVSMDIIKAGVNYIKGKREERGSKVSSFTIIDSWLNINLDTLTGVPLLIYGRYVLGGDKREAEGSQYKDVSVTAGGLGYAFNKNIRILAYYEIISYDFAPGVNDKEMFYVKSEARF